MTLVLEHDIDIFIAYLGCPSQRGLNEHSNGLLRRNRLPRQMDFTNISQNYLSAKLIKEIEFLESLWIIKYYAKFFWVTWKI